MRRNVGRIFEMELENSLSRSQRRNPKLADANYKDEFLTHRNYMPTSRVSIRSSRYINCTTIRYHVVHLFPSVHGVIARIPRINI